MINRGRVRRMARMAAYEHEDGLSDERINSYFHGDYITKQILVTFLCTSIAFVILYGVYAVDTFERLISRINTIGIQAYLVRLLMVYIVFMVIMIAVTVAVYEYRYHRARKHLAAFYHDLRKLSQSYQREDSESL